MSFLLECLDSLQGATPQGDILRLHGPPGVGKTRCTEWLKEQARQRKLRVVEVRRAPESGLHLQSVANALSRSHSGRDHAAGATRPVVEELIEAALESPLLLVLDDLADADETLVRLLEELHTVVAELPLLVVLSEDGSPSRDEAMAHFLERLDHVVLLSPLDRRAIANLIEERAWCPPAPGFVAWMHQVSQGNALAARLLLDFLQAHGALREGLDLDWATSPYPERPDLDHLLQWKLSSVSPVTHSLLETAAVLGDPFNLSTLQAITYRPPEEVDTALSEAVKAEVIEDGSDPSGATVFRWCHPLLRRTLWDRIPRRRRQRIHRLAAAFYSRGEPEPAKLAYHFGQSDDARELFFWGIRAVQKALGQGRRGEANFWLHTLLGRLEEERWLGPQPHQLREALARDQLEERAVEVWRRWFLALAGRWDGDPQELLPHEPLLFTQLLLEAAWPAERWRPAVSQALAEIAAPGRTPPPATAALYRKAVELLRQEWLARLGGGKPFPEGTD